MEFTKSRSEGLLNDVYEKWKECTDVGLLNDRKKRLKFKEISQSSLLGCKIFYVQLLVQEFSFIYLFLPLLTFAE